MTGKSRVAPLKYIIMPRMELVAVTLSVKISALTCDREMFWTDSEVTFGYIRNEFKRKLYI